MEMTKKKQVLNTEVSIKELISVKEDSKSRSNKKNGKVSKIGTIKEEKELRVVSKDVPEEFSKIFKTTEYSMFKCIGSNRRINPVNYGKLTRSMKQEQLIIPICVNEKYEVIDGQHRLKACEELGLPVYYYMLVGYSEAQMKRANLVSAVWKKDDFLHAYVSEDIEDYTIFSDLKDKYGLNTSDLLKIVAKIQQTSPSAVGVDFEEGRFNIAEEDKIALNKFLESLEDFKFFAGYRKTKFVSAFLELYFFTGYSHEQMRARLRTRNRALVEQLTKDDYVQLLTNKIYSFGNTSNNIYYDIDRKRIYTLG